MEDYKKAYEQLLYDYDTSLRERIAMRMYNQPEGYLDCHEADKMFTWITGTTKRPGVHHKFKKKAKRIVKRAVKAVKAVKAKTGKKRKYTKKSKFWAKKVRGETG